MNDSCRYFLSIWEPTGKLGEGGKPEIIKTQIKVFWRCLDAWQYVIENKIRTYTLDRAECVIDETFAHYWKDDYQGSTPKVKTEAKV